MRGHCCDRRPTLQLNSIDQRRIMVLRFDAGHRGYGIFRHLSSPNRTRKGLPCYKIRSERARWGTSSGDTSDRARFHWQQALALLSRCSANWKINAEVLTPTAKGGLFPTTDMIEPGARWRPSPMEDRTATSIDRRSAGPACRFFPDAVCEQTRCREGTWQAWHSHRSLLNSRRGSDARISEKVQTH